MSGAEITSAGGTESRHNPAGIPMMGQVCKSLRR
jgi:hypothetical protein